MSVFVCSLDWKFYGFDIDHEEKVLEVIDIIEPTPAHVNLSE